jgi:hypothetical protein
MTELTPGRTIPQKVLLAGYSQWMREVSAERRIPYGPITTVSGPSRMLVESLIDIRDSIPLLTPGELATYDQRIAQLREHGDDFAVLVYAVTEPDPRPAPQRPT